MLEWVHPSPRNIPRLQELSAIAASTCRTDSSLPEAVKLTAISSYETGFKIRARGRMGEVGPWQLMGVSPQMPLDDQAKEALRRMRYSFVLCGDLRFYTAGDCRRGGEASAKRLARAEEWMRESMP